MCGIAGRRFTPKYVEGLRPRVQQIAGLAIAAGVLLYLVKPIDTESTGPVAVIS